MSYRANIIDGRVSVYRVPNEDGGHPTASEAVTALDQWSINADRQAYRVWRDAKLKHLNNQNAIGEWFKHEKEAE
tara:strand:- start:416 stop:640 length:225 start_codon:yes stop_codon:yes gene_type:complete